MLHNQLRQMVSDSVIHPVRELTDWWSGIAVVREKDGTSVRECVNLAEINKNARRRLLTFSKPGKAFNKRQFAARKTRQLRYEENKRLYNTNIRKLFEVTLNGAPVSQHERTSPVRLPPVIL
ncbi:hypothetical protein M514_05173 [Trichuris suis]|uniref:Uncharacterized protein n=1 Tax=Trichuris suis TaxID=68888 RepID=A0A085MZX7_9BILA|nr:hypothetical protein M513_05173 [Trichuris suis]KFD62773.1 hypothetical protein M514_05173 [Trichuris suis]